MATGARVRPIRRGAARPVGVRWAAPIACARSVQAVAKRQRCLRHRWNQVSSKARKQAPEQHRRGAPAHGARHHQGNHTPHTRPPTVRVYGVNPCAPDRSRVNLDALKRASEPHGQGQGARPPSQPSFPLAGGRAVAYCSPAACRLHRAEEREREERERRAYHRHPGVRERALCAFVWVRSARVNRGGVQRGNYG